MGQYEIFDDTQALDRLQRMLKGDLDLGWQKGERAQIDVQLATPDKGLTFMDTNVEPYGFDWAMQQVRGRTCEAPRGALQAAGVDYPDLGFTVNEMSEAWAYKTVKLYEEAKARQWNATTDLPWSDLDTYEIPDVLEKSFCQVCTSLSEVEMVATEVPARWGSVMSPEFMEVKCFMYTQAVDEVRHTEIFRKRALSAQGLFQPSRKFEEVVKAIGEADTFSEASIVLHLVAEGFVLSMFRHAEFIAPTEFDKKMMRFIMQDEARHVGYGMQHLAWVLDHDPSKREVIHKIMDEAESINIGVFTSPEMVEPLIILAGQGTKKENIEQGIQITKALLAQQVEELFQRCDRAGLTDRRQRSKLPEVVQMLAG